MFRVVDGQLKQIQPDGSLEGNWNSVFFCMMSMLNGHNRLTDHYNYYNYFNTSNKIFEINQELLKIKFLDSYF